MPVSRVSSLQALLDLVSRLILERDNRQSAADMLAAHVGADECICFVKDFEVGALLPAPGFRRTLPNASAWKTFLSSCSGKAHFRGTLPSPRGQPTAVTAISTGPEFVVAFIGGAPREDILEEFGPLVPLIGAALSGEAMEQIARVKLNIARIAGDEARTFSAALSAARSELARALAEKSVQAEELERSNQELQHFAYGASHDLQEPLRKIGIYSDLLSRSIKREDEINFSYLEKIVSSTGRMRNLIRDLLDYSLLSRTSIEFSAVDLNSLVLEVLDDLETGIKSKGAFVHVSALPTVKGSRVHLSQLIQNLIGNALKYRGSDAPVIDIQCHRMGALWQFSVSDNGMGIKKEYLQQIFEIFRRLHNAQQYEGTGIGLALCKRIVQMHRGEIWAESTPGSGSVFYFTLPAD